MRYRSDERGISIVELLVAVALLAVVVVSLAAAGLYANRTLTRSRVQLESAQFLQSELERLHAVPYDSLQSGSRTAAKGTSTWTVSDSSVYSRILLITHYAPTEGVSVWDTVVAYRLSP
ncbi:MAG: hypothetical protein AMS25_10080 [Gemmatimonas sp. SM23_52]|nr:MAG: hypothetical protein AMS25_10080 [Gemmatimonas sp. SM23_52]